MPSTVENAERESAVENRDAKAKTGAGQKSAEEQLVELRRRIRAGLNKVGDDRRPKDAVACRECFQRGWIAALRSLQE